MQMKIINHNNPYFLDKKVTRSCWEKSNDLFDIIIAHINMESVTFCRSPILCINS